LKGQVQSVQSDVAGGVFYGGEDGTWVIAFPTQGGLDKPGKSSHTSASGDFDYGFCLGYFNNIRKVSNYSRVATASGQDYCIDSSSGADRTYEQRVMVTVRSVTYGPYWQRDRVIDNCDIDP
jgi:hypothetical protein